MPKTVLSAADAVVQFSEACSTPSGWRRVATPTQQDLLGLGGSPELQTFLIRDPDPLEESYQPDQFPYMILRHTNGARLRVVYLEDDHDERISVEAWLPTPRMGMVGGVLQLQEMFRWQDFGRHFMNMEDVEPGSVEFRPIVFRYILETCACAVSPVYQENLQRFRHFVLHRALEYCNWAEQPVGTLALFFKHPDHQIYFTELANTPLFLYTDVTGGQMVPKGELDTMVRKSEWLFRIPTITETPFSWVWTEPKLQIEIPESAHGRAALLHAVMTTVQTDPSF